MKVGAGAYSKADGWTISQEPAAAAEFEADKLTFMRKHVGDEAWLMLDGHMGNTSGKSWTLEIATAVARALEPFNLFFFEEPLHYTDPWGYAQLCRHTTTPIAGGECLTASYEWRVFTEQDSFDIGQPDASFTGGLVEFLAVAEMLKKKGRKVATHAWGAGGCLMQNLHAGFATENTCILEIPPDYGGLHTDLIDGGFRMQEGYVLPPDRPGLGIVLTDEIKARYPFQPGTGEFNSVPGKVMPRPQ